MDITIIVPVYNRAHLVGATLDSIAAQTLRPIHLVLVDNNSQDNTLKVLLDFKKRHQSDDFKVTVLQETRRGAAAARNCGMQEATTEWVMFFDSDDIMAPDLLESYARAVEKHADAEIILTRATLKQVDGKMRQLPYFLPCHVFRMANSFIIVLSTFFLSALQSGASKSDFGPSPVIRCMTISGGSCSIIDTTRDAYSSSVMM